MRIYLPSTPAELTAATFPPRLAHAVTPALRAALPDEDEEGLEYAAQLLAADDSLDLVTGTAGARRRVVVAADVDDAVVQPLGPDADAPSLVRLTGEVTWDDVACAHVDDADAEGDVAAAGSGDDDALDRLVERDLLWFDVTELAELGRRLTAR